MENEDFEIPNVEQQHSFNLICDYIDDQGSFMHDSFHKMDDNTKNCIIKKVIYRSQSHKFECLSCRILWELSFG